MVFFCIVAKIASFEKIYRLYSHKKSFYVIGFYIRVGKIHINVV